MLMYEKLSTAFKISPCISLKKTTQSWGNNDRIVLFFKLTIYLTVRAHNRKEMINRFPEQSTAVLTVGGTGGGRAGFSLVHL